MVAIKNRLKQICKLFRICEAIRLQSSKFACPRIGNNFADLQIGAYKIYCQCPQFSNSIKLNFVLLPLYHYCILFIVFKSKIIDRVLAQALKTQSCGQTFFANIFANFSVFAKMFTTLLQLSSTRTHDEIVIDYEDRISAQLLTTGTMTIRTFTAVLEAFR